MTTNNRSLLPLVIIFVALVVAGCGSTSLQLTVTPDPIVVTETTEAVDFVLNVTLGGFGLITIDAVHMSVTDADGEPIVNPDTGEELAWSEELDVTVPAFGLGEDVEQSIPLTYEQVKELGIHYMRISISGSRPATVETQIVLEPAPEA